MRSSWIAACAIGLAVSAALLLGSVWGASSFMRAAQDRTIERVRRDLQTYFDDETVSTVAAKRFLEMLPSGGGDFKIVDRDRMRELVRALGEVDSKPESSRALPRAHSVEDGQGSPVLGELERRAIALVHELRLASAACTLLFGLACWLFWRPAAIADAPTQAARIAACGAVLIGSGYAVTWYHLGAASHGLVSPAIVIATGLVLSFMLDALFNDFRATRAVLDISRFWP